MSTGGEDLAECTSERVGVVPPLVAERGERRMPSR